jgi:hypothetical protein
MPLRCRCLPACLPLGELHSRGLQQPVWGAKCMHGYNGIRLRSGSGFGGSRPERDTPPPPARPPQASVEVDLTMVQAPPPEGGAEVLLVSATAIFKKGGALRAL